MATQRLEQDLATHPTDGQVPRSVVLEALAHGFGEVLDLLLMPLPGRLLGLDKVRMVAMFGALGYQTANAAVALIRGQAEGFVTAVGDIADLIISAKLHRHAAQLTKRRLRRSLAEAGNPFVRKLDNDVPVLQWPGAPYRPRDSVLTEPLASLADEALLSTMQRPGLPVIAPERMTTLLALSGITRYQVEQVWHGETPPPAALEAAWRAELASQRIDALHAALGTPTRSLKAFDDLTLPLIAHLTGTTIEIVDAQGAVATSYTPAHGASAARLALQTVGDGLYTPWPNSTAARPSDLVGTSLQALELQSADSTWGRVGSFSVDQHVANRVHHWRNTLAQSLADRHLEVFEQHLAESNRLVPREVRALSGLLQAQGRGSNADSECLFASLLPLVAHWPDGLGVHVFQGLQRPGGQWIKPAKALDHYGPQNSTDFIALVRQNGRYAGYDADNDNILWVAPHSHSLSEATLRSLDDTQRQALGLGLHEAEKLRLAVSELALQMRTDLPAILQGAERYSLTSSRLIDFVSSVDLSDATPDSRGLFEVDGALYLQHENRSYRALQDLEASTPARSVWRIVREQDAVADDTDNRYVATRPGRSEAVHYAPEGHWVGHVLPGAGGMRSSAKARDAKGRIAAIKAQANEARAVLEEGYGPIEQSLEQLHALANQLFTGSPAERQTTRDRYQAATAAHVKLLENRVTLLDSHEATLTRAASDIEYFQKARGTVYSLLVNAYEQLMGAQQSDHDALQPADADSYADSPQRYLSNRQSLIALLERKEVLATRRDQWIARARQDVPGSVMERDLRFALGVDPVNSLYLKAARARFQGDQLAVGAPGQAAKMHQYNGLAMALINNVISLENTRALDYAEQLEPLERLQQQFEYVKAGYQHVSQDRILPEQVALLEQVISHLDYYQALTLADLEKAWNSLEATPDHRPPKAASRSRKKAVLVRQRHREQMYVGDEAYGDDGEITITLQQARDAQSTTLRRSISGNWNTADALQDTPELPDDGYASLLRSSRASLRSLESSLQEADRKAAANESAINITDFTERKADEFDALVRQLQHAHQKQNTPEAEGDLIKALQAASATLLSRGKAHMHALYKNPDFLDPNRLLTLIADNEVTVIKEPGRKKIGKGKNASYLDVYRIADRQTATPLWEAHFHYDSVERAPLNYPLGDAHLKTHKQARLGSKDQARDEQQGKPHTPHWRERINHRVAAKIFAAAQPS